jgi:hypothetical protein
VEKTFITCGMSVDCVGKTGKIVKFCKDFEVLKSSKVEFKNCQGTLMRGCFLGESFVNGPGDRDCLGWARRICQAAYQKSDLTRTGSRQFKWQTVA